MDLTWAKSSHGTREIINACSLNLKLNVVDSLDSKTRINIKLEHMIIIKPKLTQFVITYTSQLHTTTWYKVKYVRSSE